MTSFWVQFFYYFSFTVCLLFVISGIDDLFYDLTYWASRLYSTMTGKPNHPYKKINRKEMLSKAESRIAFLIACWHEDEVIEKMVKNTIQTLNYENYDIFLGVYPNDQKTVDATQRLANEYNNVHVVINCQEGPTTKGQNLNWIINRILAHEKETQRLYSFIVVSDAEDIVSELELKLFNYLEGEFDLIQIPVLPLPKPWHKFTYWTYADEFSEIHTKDLVVRNLVNGLVPTAGTGTALSRKCVVNLLQYPPHQVFDPEMFTEDYDLAIHINNQRLKVAFVKALDPETKALPQSKGGTIPWICIKEYFPDIYANAIRQKARWIFGIVFQGWMKWGWSGTLLTKFCLFHDRKGIFSHFVNFAGYLVILIFIVLYFLPNEELITLILSDGWLRLMLWACFFLMFQRMLQRLIAVTTCYNIKYGLLSIPRVFFANFLNAHAFIRAFKLFIAKRRAQKIVWDKTAHSFPDADLDKNQQIK